MTLARCLQLVLFLLGFSLEVRVRAEETVTQDPPACLRQAGPCAVKTIAGKIHTISVGAATLVMEGDSLLVRTASDSATLVVGAVWVRSPQGTFTIRTEFGSVAGRDGDFWVERDRSRMTAIATTVPLILEPLGLPTALGLPVGMENWIGGVQPDGLAAHGVSLPLNFRRLVSRWIRMYPGTREAFAAEIEKLSGVWKSGAQDSADYHRALAERRIATIEDERRRQEEALAQRHAEERALRKLFRQKNYLE